MRFYGYFQAEQLGGICPKSTDFGTASTKNFVSGLNWESFRKFCKPSRQIAKVITSWKLIPPFAKCISTQPERKKFSEIKILELHAAVKPPKLLSGGQVHDSEVAIDLLSKITLEGKKVLTDKAFCSEEIRNFISEKEAVACIPDKSNAVVKHDFDPELYKARNIIERFFQRIKNFRHIATRYDKLSICFLNFVILAAVMIQL